MIILYYKDVIKKILDNKTSFYNFFSSFLNPPSIFNNAKVDSKTGKNTYGKLNPWQS